ncbi:hypothetical protein [Limnoglobus roseus]|uniref:Uncharacterized protein n=1 Tax=Limnoglobus roseus TaxID=2598579 RepID=A0A5C1AMA8_9BACT|nr:hypothetical protein [Limnoglobus roseus]QEL18324.1 hypothetical protein PX52LOC_05345 [Limnoglobus roseus]
MSACPPAVIASYQRPDGTRIQVRKHPRGVGLQTRCVQADGQGFPLCDGTPDLRWWDITEGWQYLAMPRDVYEAAMFGDAA